jgi:hypothetical protein
MIINAKYSSCLVLTDFKRDTLSKLMFEFRKRGIMVNIIEGNYINSLYDPMTHMTFSSSYNPLERHNFDTVYCLKLNYRTYYPSSEDSECFLYLNSCVVFTKTNFFILNEGEYEIVNGGLKIISNE